MGKLPENWLGNASGFSAVAAAFFLPLFTTPFTIFYLLSVSFSVLNFRNWCLQTRWWRHPVILVTGLFFLLYLLGLSYSVAGWHDRLKDLNHHLWIFFGILLMPIFTEKKWRSYAINAFLCAMVLTLILSYCKYYGYFSWAPERGRGAVFNSYIFQSILMAFSSVLLLDQFLMQAKKEWYLLVIAVLMIFNIFFFSEGRSGYITFALLFCYLLYYRFHARGAVAAILVVLALGGLAYIFSNLSHARINEALLEADHLSNYNTSLGRRYAEASNSWYLVKKSPLIGYGTGGISAIYHTLPTERFQRADIFDRSEIDLDYFNILMKFGFIGLFVVLAFFFTLWYQANSLEGSERYICHSIVLLFLLGAFANPMTNIAYMGHFLSIFVALLFAPLIMRNKRVPS